MDDIKTVLQNTPDVPDDGDGGIAITRGTDGVSSAIRQATGLNITPEALDLNAETPESGIKIARPIAQTESDPDTAVVTENVPAAVPSGGRGMGVLSADEAAQLLKQATPQKIDVEGEIDAARTAHIDQLAEQQQKGLENMLDEALKAEEARTARHEAALEDPEQVKQIYQGDAPGAAGGKVSYTSPLEDGDAPAPAADSTPAQKTGRIDMSMEINTQVNADLDSLVPTYTDNHDDKEEPAPSADLEDKPVRKRPSPRDSEEEYAAFVRTAPVSTPDDQADTVMEVVKEKKELQQVPSGRQKDKIIGDQAFMNAINKFKRDNFRTIGVPLVNSGFMADIVGTGAVDLTQLYSVVDENTLLVDYELEKMRVVMRAVVDTHPKINSNDLRNMIHFADYQMMAYAHVAATLKDVELVTTCEECGKDFRISADSKALLVNMADLQEKKLKIRQASTIRENSLMSDNLELSTTDGFRIILGHPSYGEYVLYLTELKAIIARLDAGQAARVRSMATELPYVRGIQMPTGVHANNLFQRYMAITMLSDDAKTELDETIEKLKKQIVFPKFGVRRVKCPYCGKTNTDIIYDNLEDLLFFHFTVTRWMKGTEQSSENG